MIKEYEIGDGRKVSAIYNNGVAEVSKEMMERIIIPAFIKAEKYKWHDLREDPGDLPKKNGIYLVAMDDGVNIFFNTMLFWEGEFDRVTIYPKVAWKCIEPFESEAKK